jgi:Cu-Zn family superoxide dismutase
MVTRIKHAPTAALVVGALTVAGCGAEPHGSGGSGDAAAPVATAPPGEFVPVRGAPARFSGVSGTAEVTAARSGGTDVSISLRGLRPNAKYLAHVHVGGCDQPDPGGPHFKFDPNGSETPPNEIHLRLATNATGGASAQANNSRAIPPAAARSIVVHADDAAAPAAQAPQADTPPASGGHQGHGSSGDTAANGAAGGHAHSDKVACAALPVEGAAGASSGSPSPRGAPVAIQVKGNSPVDGVRELEVRKGDRVRFTVTADQPEDVHVHGYELLRPVTPTAPAEFDFEARIEGIFEVELERAGVQVVSLRVNPR